MTTKHYHKLKRLTYKNGEQIYFCTLDCKFKVNVKVAIGKKVLCNRCDKLFVMNELSIRQAKPHCNDCTNRKTDKVSLEDLSLSNLQKEDGFTSIPEPRVGRISKVNDLSPLKSKLRKQLEESYKNEETQNEESQNETILKDSTSIPKDTDIL